MSKQQKVIAEGHSLRLIKCVDMGPDDGNPYFVEHKTAPSYSASLACALDTGELDGRDGAFRLTEVQLTFLQREADKLEDY